jgi:hypothetical protein
MAYDVICATWRGRWHDTVRDLHRRDGPIGVRRPRNGLVALSPDYPGHPTLRDVITPTDFCTAGANRLETYEIP